ncbi:dodecin [Halomonas marinisediminis]|uniref:Dodecin domain-containing protein n=1 Tax=Halomonas marinisediminis TaxID=2546095 RepID=A0ABY2D5Q4_9GAMM|nr:dodecin [Halomonas marinisediminis]TDB02047.1 dodecin domain-containing protein [Halomonas marinisediminis]
MSNHVYKHLELTGSSEQGIQQAIESAIGKASESLHGMRWFEVIDTRGHIEHGRVQHWQVTIKVGFTLD